MGKLAFHGVLCVLPVLWLSLSQAAPNPTPAPSKQGVVCGQQYDEIYAASKNWHAQGFTPEHEAQYKELKEKCAQAHRERDEKAKAVTTNLPTYTSSIFVALSQLNASLKNELSTLEQIVRDQYGLLEDAWKYGVELQHELVRTNVESDRIERALLYHAILQDSSPKQVMTDSYTYHGSNGRMVARLLKFVRALPSKAERIEAYTELERLLKSNGQDERFPAVIFSHDVKQLGAPEYTPDHAQLGDKAVTRWQALLLDGNFTEMVLFAHDHPEYFGEIQGALIAALDKTWSIGALEKVTYFPNALPRPEQRVAALKGVVEALLHHQEKQHNDVHLMRLAKELEKLEQGLGAGDDPKVQERVGEVKALFGQFSYTRDFPTYVELYGIFKSTL